MRGITLVVVVMMLALPLGGCVDAALMIGGYAVGSLVGETIDAHANPDLTSSELMLKNCRESWMRKYDHWDCDVYEEMVRREQRGTPAGIAEAMQKAVPPNRSSAGPMLPEVQEVP